MPPPRKSRVDYEPDVVSRYNSSTKKAPVLAPDLAPAPAPAPYVSPYKGSLGSLEDYVASQQAAFTPQLTRTIPGEYSESGITDAQNIYSTFDPYAATSDYLGKRQASALGSIKDAIPVLNALTNYSGSLDQLTKDIGYTGPKSIVYGKGDEAQTESGSTGYSPDIFGLHPDLLDTLSGYNIKREDAKYGYPGIGVYKPDGTLVGTYKIGDKDSWFDKLMEAAVPVALTAMTGGALAPVFGGGVLGTALGQGIASGTMSAAQGGNFGQGFLSGAVSGGIGSGIGSVVNPLANSAASVVGDAAGSLAGDSAGLLASDITRGAVKGAFGSGAGALLTGTSVGDAVLSGALGGGVNAGVGNLAGDYLKDVPRPLQNAAASAAAAAILGNDPKAAAINSGLSSLSGWLRGAAAAENPTRTAPAPREVTDIQPPSAIDYGDYFSSLPSDIYGTVPDIGAVYEPTPIDAELGFAPYTSAAPSVDTTTTSPIELGSENNQVVITGTRPPPEPEDDYYAYLPSLSGEQSPIELGSENNQVVVTGTRLPPEPEIELPPYDYAMPALDPVAIPEVSAPAPAPTPAPATVTPSTGGGGFDIIPLLNLLAANAVQPVPSQELAHMQGFDVDSMSQFLQQQRGESQEENPQDDFLQQQPELADLLAAIGYKG